MQLLILIKYGKMPVNLGMAQFFLQDNLVSLSIVNGERKKKLSRKLILMICTMLLCLRTIQHSGNAGGLNLELQSKCSQVDGCVDPEIIAHKFVQHFRTNISCSNAHKAEVLKQSYLTLRATYCGLPIIQKVINLT